jgi:hypothetical protein
MTGVNVCSLSGIRNTPGASSGNAISLPDDGHTRSDPAFITLLSSQVAVRHRAALSDEQLARPENEDTF